MCYMMSKTSYLFDQGGHTMSHVMFYTADDGTPWGANLATLPSSALATGPLHLTLTRN